MNKRSEELLLEKQVKPTAMRILIAEEFLKNKKAIGLQTLENLLPTADKTTIYRTVKTFLDNDVIHAIILPDGRTEYALCKHKGNQHNVHPHFTCKKCGQTYCLPEIKMPSSSFPKGYTISETILTLSGICPQCKQL